VTDYRWNQTNNARGYDAAAEFVHPYYHAIQDVVLEHLPLQHEDPATIVDLGGGSGRLAERILDRFPHTTVWVIC
jgi:trans-aconitate methyltransferase